MMEQPTNHNSGRRLLLLLCFVGLLGYSCKQNPKQSSLSDSSMSSAQLCLSKADLQDFAEDTSGKIEIDADAQQVVATHASGEIKSFDYKRKNNKFCFDNSELVIFLYDNLYEKHEKQ